jgi:hypothetical protein
MITTTDFLASSDETKINMAVDGITRLNADAEALIQSLSTHNGWMKVIAELSVDPANAARLERASNNFRYKMEKLLRQIDESAKQVVEVQQRFTPIQNV